MEKIPGNTLADFPPESFAIYGLCDACSRHAPVERKMVPEDIPVQELAGRLRCRACGTRSASIRLVYIGAGEYRRG